jgi:hypothetical protein
MHLPPDPAIFHRDRGRCAFLLIDTGFKTHEEEDHDVQGGDHVPVPIGTTFWMSMVHILDSTFQTGKSQKSITYDITLKSLSTH